MLTEILAWRSPQQSINARYLDSRYILFSSTNIPTLCNLLKNVYCRLHLSLLYCTCSNTWILNSLMHSMSLILLINLLQLNLPPCNKFLDPTSSLIESSSITSSCIGSSSQHTPMAQSP